MKSDDAKRLRDLEIENRRLKELLAEAELDKKILKMAGKLLSPARRREAVTKAKKTFGVSERRACKTLSS